MSLTRIILSLLVALLIGGTSLLQAEDTPAKGGGRGGIKGSITAVDATTFSFKGGDGGDAVKYTVNDSTKISIDRMPAKLADIKVGDNGYVRVDTTDKTLCVRLSIRRAGAPGAGNATPAPDAGAGPAK